MIQLIYHDMKYHDNYRLTLTYTRLEINCGTELVLLEVLTISVLKREWDQGLAGFQHLDKA